MVAISALISALALAGAATAGTFNHPAINLDSKTWKEAMSVEHAGMVVFYAPWCGHCKNLAPEWTAAAQSLSPLIPFYAVDCDESANKPLCAKYEVKGFPTIKAFPKGSQGAVKDFNGERKRGALVEYAKSLVPDRVKKLRVEEGGAVDGVLQKFLDDKPDLPHALLIHPSAPSIPFLWKVLGHRFASKLHLGFIRDTASHSILSSLGIYDPQDTTRETTRVVAWKAGAERPEIVEHGGVMKFNALLEFLQAHSDGTPMPVQEPPAEAPKEKESAPLMSNEGRRQRARERMEEEERRDKARREKLAAQRAQAKEPEAEAEEKGTPVDADPPASAEGVEDEPPVKEDSAPDPAPEAAPEEGVEEESAAAEPVETEAEGRVHEEL